MMAASIHLGGMTPFTATDFPGKLAAVAFVQGCPWRCHYCHNQHLQTRHALHPIPWSQFTDFLQKRIGLLDAVVFSGGEPTLDPALPQAMEQVKQFGFLVGLHTGGIYPDRLAEVLPMSDWVGLDIKAEFHRYDTITCVVDSGAPALSSLRLLLESGVAYECRTTLHPQLHSAQNIERLARQLAELGVRRYALQCYRAIGAPDNDLFSTLPTSYPDPDLIDGLRAMFDELIVRKDS